MLLPILFFLLSLLPITGAAAPSPLPATGTPGSSLALSLQNEGAPRSAAVEWRRLALQATGPQEQAGYYWAAAYQYLHAHDPMSAERMLDEAENAWWDIENASLILRAQVAEQRKDHSTAAFYWSSILRAQEDGLPQARLAHRKLANLAARSGDTEQARTLLKESPTEESQALQALLRFEQGRDKSPRLGGLLGIIPGMGYAYAGEYGNMIRSIILNTIFIYGMVDTAQNDQWGAFAAITFFELTWYSGSIYGGIDASHRYNQRRRDELHHDISGSAHFTPDWNAIPNITLEFSF